jgi:hypothetical protein
VDYRPRYCSGTSHRKENPQGGSKMTYLSVDELVAENSDTNTLWESKLDYELVQELLGHDLSKSEWAQLINELDDLVFETVMSYQK